MQAKFRNLGTQGSILFYNNVAHKFNLAGTYEGGLSYYPQGLVDVNVVSIAVLGGKCEIAVNINSDFKKYRSKLPTPEVLSSVLARGNFNVAVLRRNVPFGDGKTIRQIFIVCNKDVNPLNYISHLMLEEIK